ncbi:leucine-rich repeat-containing protein 9 [Pholidichthys leucotaenia]
MFFSGFPHMVGLSFFPRLCQLTIVDQNIKRIEELEGCPLLQELWIVQCHLTEISGLQNCLQLEKLYLYDNKISEINNLEMQVKLEVLWLNNNCITRIQGLNTLKNLKELNLADNLIEKIGHGLDSNVRLENLNLSGNKINSFKELTPLSHLSHLREFALNDPVSTPNPVCLLCNYATHILYHMPGLQTFDTYDVSCKQVKETAESAVMKKMMYYNMRVRTLQRNLAETKLSLTETKKDLLQLPEECITILSYSLKCLERELSRAPFNYKKSDCFLEEPRGTTHLEGNSTEGSDSTTDISHDPAAMEHKIQRKIDALKGRLKLWNMRLDEVEALYEQVLAQATNRVEYMVEFLLTELESVGNIRLEEGCPTDPWFTSCSDLLFSRFSPSDFKIYGIADIKVDRVVRVHNSALRLRFEEKLHSLLDKEENVFTCSLDYRRHLDYLFYIPNLEKNEKEETLSILEEGFRTAEQTKALGRDYAVPLSNSLYVAEQPRIEHALHQASQSKQTTDPVPFRHGHVIVCKVFVGNSTLVQDGEPVERSSYLSFTSMYRNIDTKHRTAMKTSQYNETHPGPDCNPHRRQWFVFDHELVLPEFIIIFEYITGEKQQYTLLNQSPGRNTAMSNDILVDKEVLNMEPVLKPQPRLLSLDDKILLNAARANVLSQITVLNLHGNSLSRIKEISSLTALRHLTISFNKFTHIDDISQMPDLEYLDASFNQLVTLEGLRRLGQLKQLDVSWNKLTKARKEASVLRKHTPALLKFDTRHNPWNKPEMVRLTILGRLTTLTHLDEVLVAEEEAAKAVQMAAGSKISQVSLLAHSRIDGERPRSLSLLSTAQLLCYLTPAPWRPRKELEPDWTAKITTLNLDNQRIPKLINLNTLVNLRWASFNDNEISKVEGLECCLKLEELSLNNNSISIFTGFAGLTCLNKLSIDGNKLTNLDPTVFDQIPNLSFLSMENNCITSLHGIQRLGSLLELYIGNNQISTSRDIYCLKGLTNLIILDLYGNPLVEKLENYRIYVVFHLTSLKVLDGIAVEASESENVKNMFRGRLTTDTVVEKLGHSNYTEITHLTLQSCSIRTVDLSAELFCNLHSVNLDHNNLTSFSGLIYLPSIKALCLNYNHVESILPRQKTQAHLTNKQILHSKVHSSGYGQQGPSKANRDTGPASSLEPLMGSLEVLHLSHNGISNMANLQLSRFTNLKALFLQGNEISQVEGLEGLHQLRELVLDRNRIKVLAKDSLRSQNALIELHLAGNRIRELNHFSPLIELHKLFLDANKLQDVTELGKLEVLPALTELSVVGNPVARNSLHRQAVMLCLPQLQFLDGVVITPEERTRAQLLSTDPSPSTHHPGASLPTVDINLLGPLPLMPHNTALRGMSTSGGQQTFMYGYDILQSNVDEDHQTFICKKNKYSKVARSGQMDINFQYNRRTGGNLTATGLPDGNSDVFGYSQQDQDSRLMPKWW